MTRKEAMDAQCRLCAGVPKGGDYTPIKECSANDDPDSPSYCPLWEWRPGGGKKTREISPEQREAASARLREYHARAKAAQGA